MTTPRPWQARGYYIETPDRHTLVAMVDSGCNDKDGREKADANAALIVRAVNTFDEAKNRLNEMRAVLLGGSGLSRKGMLDRIEATLAKMEDR
jgi:hypothetical protein